MFFQTSAGKPWRLTRRMSRTLAVVWSERDLSGLNLLPLLTVLGGQKILPESSQEKEGKENRSFKSTACHMGSLLGKSKEKLTVSSSKLKQSMAKFEMQGLHIAGKSSQVGVHCLRQQDGCL